MNSNQPQADRPRSGMLGVLVCMALLVWLVGGRAWAAVPLVAEATSGTASTPPNLAPGLAPPRTAFLPLFKPHRPAIYDSLPHNVTPHPAVARIIVPEGRATAYGSGTLVDVWAEHGLVVTNWHVVRDSQGTVEVVFPCGFRSHARPLKVDSNWDLAALVIWRPPVEPVKLANQPPRQGDLLTIHGYGRGQYRIATGRCTTYYAPRINFPHELVELDVEARQGDSGGPIFNQQGELAGVLFGAGQGTTLGSFAPRVRHFLATVAPELGKDKGPPRIAEADRLAPNVHEVVVDYWSKSKPEPPSSPWLPPEAVVAPNAAPQAPSIAANIQVASASAVTSDDSDAALSEDAPINEGWYDSLKSALAIVGVAAIALQLIKAVR